MVTKRSFFVWVLTSALFLILIAGCGPAETAPVDQTTAEVPVDPSVKEQIVVESPSTPGEGEGPETGIKEFTMTAKQWDFQPEEIRVKKGDTVLLKVKSIDVRHGFASLAYGFNIILNPGKEEVVEFIADKTGTFSFLCTVPCGVGHSGMTGKIIVE